MIFAETELKGAFIIDVKRLEDERGFFGRSYCLKELQEHGINVQVAQANVSYNKKKGTLRGMHMQLQPYGETKLIRCTRGSIFDVIVDLRPDSPTFLKWIGVELTADSYRMLFVPENFAHGFITLEDNTDVTYNVSQFYTPSAEKGFRYDDPAFNIIWPIKPEIVSEKDKAHQLFEEKLLTMA